MQRFCNVLMIYPTMMSYVQLKTFVIELNEIELKYLHHLNQYNGVNMNRERVLLDMSRLVHLSTDM